MGKDFVKKLVIQNRPKFEKRPQAGDVVSFQADLCFASDEITRGIACGVVGLALDAETRRTWRPDAEKTGNPMGAVAVGEVHVSGVVRTPRKRRRGRPRGGLRPCLAWGCERLL